MGVFDLLNGNNSSNMMADGDTIWWSKGSPFGTTKPKAGIRISQESAMCCAAAYACTRAIAETLASLPAMVYETLDDATRKKARQDPIYRLLHDRPNDEMDSMIFFEMMTKRVVNRGNGFAEIERNQNDEPVNLWPIHNSRVRPWRRKARLVNGRWEGGEIEFHVSVNDIHGFRHRKPTEDERYYVIPDRDMLNVVGFGSEDGILAPGVIPHANEELSLNIAAQLYGASFFGNGARPQGVIEHPAFIKDPSRRSEFRSDVNRLHQGYENWQNVGILWDNAKWKELQVNPEQAQFLETRAGSDKNICRFYNVPPAIAQIYEDFKFNSVEAMIKLFVMLTIRPYAVRFERAIGRQIITQVDDNMLLEFVMNALLRGDPKTQAETNEIKRRNGVINGDEWRAQDNDNPLPDGLGQHYLVPLNHATIEQVVNRPLKAIASGSESNSDDGKKENQTKADRDAVQGDRAFAARVLSDSVERMISVECKAINRCAKHPETILQTSDEFYAKFESTMLSAVQLGVEGVMRAEGLPNEFSTEPFALAAVRSWIELSREELLEACEVPSKDLSQAISSLTESWRTRELKVESLLVQSSAS